MKKLILVGCLSIFCFQSVIAQFSLDVSGGINNSITVFSSDLIEVVPNTNYSLGYYLGITPKYSLTEKLTCLTDIQYSVRGFKTENNDKAQYEYIDIAPNVEYRLNDYLSIGVGVNVGFLQNTYAFLDDGTRINTTENRFIDSSDFGLLGSIRGNYENIFLIVRYMHGVKSLSSISFTDANGNVIGETKQMNRNFQIGLGYTFQFRKTE